LVEDGQRLAPTDTARAATRFREAVELGAAGEAAGRASLGLVSLDLSRASRPEDLPPVVEKLNRLARTYQTVTMAANQLRGTVAGVLAASALTPDTPQGDLRLFLAAEAVRDTLAAPRLANAMFHRIHEDWPWSPYAPKAILAAQQLDSTWTDSARVLLEERYLDSPYLALIRGEATPAYRQLEDSLGRFSATLSAPAQRSPGARRAPPPSRPDDDNPVRRAPAAPNTRVIDPR
jgi:hypothetical protein